MPLKIVGFFPSNASIGKRINEIWAADVPELAFLGGEYRTGKLVFCLVDGVNKPFLVYIPPGAVMSWQIQWANARLSLVSSRHASVSTNAS